MVRHYSFIDATNGKWANFKNMPLPCERRFLIGVCTDANKVTGIPSKSGGQ